MLFYDQVPKLFGLPSKSVDNNDRAQEAKVKAVGDTFMAAWAKNDTKGLLKVWHNWPNTQHAAVKGLKFT